MSKDLIAIARDVGAIIDTKLGAPYDVIHITPAQLEAFAAALSSATPAGGGSKDERRAFEQHIEATEKRKPMLWSTAYANGNEVCPAPLEGVYFQVADQKAWLAWQAARALSAAQPVAQPVVDQEPASMSDNGSCGSQVSGKPVSAEPDRYKRALEAIIANPGGASAKRIATLALGLDGTEQVSAEAGKGVERDAYVADLIDTFEQLRQILGTPEQDADALIAASRRLASESVAVSGEAMEPKEWQCPQCGVSKWKCTCAANWPKLDKPARVNSFTFRTGVSAQLVVERAQREHELHGEAQARTPDEWREIERNRRALWDMANGPLGSPSESAAVSAAPMSQPEGKPWDMKTAHEKAPDLIAQLDEESERITRYGGSGDALLNEAARVIEALTQPQPEPTSKGAIDDSAAVEWVSKWMGDFDVVLPNKAFKLLIRKVSSSQQREPQEAAERPVSAYRREAVETIKALGYQWADGKWSAPQEASKVEPVAWLYTAKASEPPMNPIISRTRWSPDNTCHASFDEHPLYLRPTQQALSDEEIEGIGHRKAWRYKYSSDPHHSSTYTFNRMCLIEFARAILAAAGGSEK